MELRRQALAELTRYKEVVDKLPDVLKERAAAEKATLAAADPFGAPAADVQPKLAQLNEEKLSNGRSELSRTKDRQGTQEFLERDAAARADARQFYRKLDKTQEWAENNYYHLPIDQQNADLITVNAFWRDYAQFGVGGGRESFSAPRPAISSGASPKKIPDPLAPPKFRSVNFAEASHNFPEMMFALAVLDLPFAADKHETKFDQAQMTLTPGSPLILFHQEIKQVPAAKEPTPILVSQNFFRHGDRTQQVNNEQVDKFVTEEFLVGVVYGCQVVVTNPTSSKQKLDVLLQIPRGAIPVLKGRETRSVHIDLESGYATLFNRNHDRSGPLFQGRFHAVNVEDDGHSHELTRYVHLNPVRAALVADPLQYRWSSHRWYLNPHGVPDWLDYRSVLAEFAARESSARVAYKRFVDAGLQIPPVNPLGRTVDGWILGSEAFVARCRELSERGASRQRQALTLDAIATAVEAHFGVSRAVLQRRGCHGNEPRDVAIWLARELVSEPLECLAAFFGGGTRSAISETVRRVRDRLPQDSQFCDVIDAIRRRL